MPIPFAELVAKRRGADFQAPERLLCLDPGETTGYAVFSGTSLVQVGQSPTYQGGWWEIHNLFAKIEPTHVVYENYRVYAHKLERHSYSEVYTLRLIGVIEYLCTVNYNIPFYNQMALEAKGFCTDDRLKDWGFYKEGLKHGRDAIRHGVHFLLHNKEIDVKAPK